MKLRYLIFLDCLLPLSLLAQSKTIFFDGFENEDNIWVVNSGEVATNWNTVNEYQDGLMFNVWSKNSSAYCAGYGYTNQLWRPAYANNNE